MLHSALLIDPGFGHLAAIIIAIRRYVVGALEFAGGLIFHNVNLPEAQVGTAHAATGARGFCFRYCHDSCLSSSILYK